MASELDLPKALAELITQLNNLRRLITIGGKQYKYDAKSNSYKGDGGKSFSVSQLKGKAREFYQTAKTAVTKNTAKKLKIKKGQKKGKEYVKSQQAINKGILKNQKVLKAPEIPTDKLKIKKKTPTDTKTTTKKKGFYERYGITQQDVKNAEKTGKNKDGTWKMSRGTKRQVNQGSYGKGGAAGATGGAILSAVAQPVTDRATYWAINKLKGTKGTEKGFKEYVDRINNPLKYIKKKPEESAYNKAKKESKTGLANLPKNEGTVVVRGKVKGEYNKAQQVNPDYGVKGQPDKIVNENKKKLKVNKTGSSGKKMHAIEKRNREIFGNKKIDDLKDYHKRWKAARKAGRLKEFKEKEKKKRMNR